MKLPFHDLLGCSIAFCSLQKPFVSRIKALLRRRESEENVLPQKRFDCCSLYFFEQEVSFICNAM